MAHNHHASVHDVSHAAFPEQRRLLCSNAALLFGTLEAPIDRIECVVHAIHAMHAMQDMVDRYIMFLKLRKAAPEVFAVPPVDVDFIWHTHMSMSAQYHKMSLQHFGGLVSHETVSPEDSARTFKRDTGFGGTQRAWAELFPGKLCFLFIICFT